MIAVILLVLGVVTAGAGIVTIGFGIPISDFSIGSTLILAGSTALSAGLVLVGLAAAVNQLVQIGDALRVRGSLRPRASEPSEPEVPTPTARVPQAKVQSKPSLPPKMPGKPPAGERAADAPAAADTDAAPPAIERLRSSLARADRAHEEAADAGEEAPAPVATTNGSGRPASGDETKKPRLDFLFGAKAPRATPRESFETAWPRRGQAPAEPEAQATGAARTEPPPRRSPPADTPPSEPRQPAVLKSGVVDGMAYTLYSDGSIEAKLPQGTVRFGSIAELRSHIEQSS